MVQEFNKTGRYVNVRSILLGATTLFILLSFQNCGQGFDNASSVTSKSLGDSNFPGSIGTSPNGGGSAYKQCAPPESSGAAAAHRLSNEQYNNIARDLLGIITRPADQLPSVLYERFDNEAEALGEIAANQLDIYWSLAEKLAAEAVTKNLAKVASCIPKSGQTAAQIDNCVKQSIRDFALSAFRRMPSEETLILLKKVYDSDATSFNSGFTLVVRAVLSSPRFLYHTVDSDSAMTAGIENLDDYEIASRLSFFLWNTMPDAELLSLAGKGQLQNPAVLSAQLTRMLANPKISALSQSFASQWFGLSDIKSSVSIDKKLYPDYDDSLVSSAYGETMRFFNEVVIKDKPLVDILSSQESYIDSNLAKVYDLPDPGEGFKLVALPPQERRGLLTQASIMMADGATERTVPIHRGLWVMKHLTCNEPAMPSDELRQVIEEASQGKEYTEGQIRERLAQHQRVGPSCMACHAMMDPVGLAFENYNPIGETRKIYSDGLPVDSSGEMDFVDETGKMNRQTFAGAVELSQKLVTDVRVHKCMSEHLYAYANQRRIASADRCNVDTLARDYIGQKKSLTETIRAIVLSPSFVKVTRGAQ